MLCDLVLILISPLFARIIISERKPFAAYLLFMVAKVFDPVAVFFRPYPDDAPEWSFTRQTRYELVPIRKVQLLLLGRQYVILL